MVDIFFFTVVEVIMYFTKRYSHIGRRIIKLPPQVKYELKGNIASFESAKGMLQLELKDFVSIKDEQDKLIIKIKDESLKEQKQMWGTTNKLIRNIIQGLSEGFSLPLKMVGVGYRAALENGDLVLRVGKSHPSVLKIPTGIQVLVPAPQRIILQGISWPNITQFAARIRKERKPEPYNQKGIFVGDETIKKKEGKKR